MTRINDNIREIEVKIDDEHDAIDERLLILEKLLKFSNINRPNITFNKFDDHMRSMIDEFFTPTTRRVLELQEKMGELSKIYLNQQR